MSDLEETILELTDENEPLIHQAGKFLVGGLAGLFATYYAKAGYDKALEWFRNRKTSV